MASDFPIVDRNRLISRASRTLLEQVSPASWHMIDIGGEADFGLDVLVQLEVDGVVRHVFFIQLKGAESLALVNGDSAISYPLNRTTLNYYASIVPDVMLAVAKVTLDETGKLILNESRLHWQWMSKELKDRRGSSFDLDLGNGKTTNVHIPIEQVLHARLDVREHLEQQRVITSAGVSLEDLLRQSLPLASSGAHPFLPRLVDIARQRPSTMSMLIQTEGEIPLEALPPIAIEIRALIRAGNTAQAEAALKALQVEGFGTAPAQRAAYLSLQGKVLIQRRRRDEALAMFEQAYATDSTVEHLLPLAETRFLQAVDAFNSEDIRDICVSLKDIETDDCLALRVRLHIALKEFVEAENCLLRISEAKRRISHLVLLSSKRNWREAMAVATGAESDGSLSLADVTSAQLIAARAAWCAATEDLNTTRENVDEIPLSGAVGTRLAPTRDAWTLAVKALKGLKTLGWPPNVEIIAPIVCGVAGVLGHQTVALELLGDAAAHRPEYEELQLDLELLAIGAREPEKALEANLRQQATMDVLTRRTSLFFELRKYAQSVETALNIARSMESPSTKSPMALATGYAAAHRIGYHVKAAELQNRLRSKPEWGEYLYFAEFAKLSSLRSGEEQRLAVLRDGLAQHPDSWLLAANLYSNLNVSEETSAAEAVELTKRLRQRALLSLDEVLHLVAAHTTLKNWNETATEVADGLERFQGNERLLAMGAVAQEMLGRTGAALSMLEQALAAGTNRTSVVHNYMGLALRLGRIDAVRSAIDRLLTLITDRAERLELLRLSVLTYIQEGRYQDAYAAVEALGHEVKQSDEQEEGVFLNVVMAATLQGPPTDDAFRAAFWLRMDAFCTKWPESRLFRRMGLPAEGVSELDDLHRLLDPLVGDSRARIREFEQRERQARRGEFPVPFILRPGFVLHYIGDPFMLWEIAARSRPEDKQFHLSIVGAGQEPKSPNPTRDIPLLDLTALLVLDALNLFDKVFAVFGRVAITRLTVGFVSQNANGVLAGGAGMVRAKSILAAINRCVGRIDQPGAFSVGNGASIASTDVLREYMHLAKRSNWLVYSDDAICRVAILEGSPVARFCTTLDVLELADHSEILTASQIATSLAALAGWNVGINVADRYLIASLVGALPDHFRGDASSRLDTFQGHGTFTTLSRAIWHPGKDATDLVAHMSQLLCSMLHSPDSEVNSIAAVLASWFIRVRLLQKTEGCGWKLICYPVMIALSATPDARCGRLVGVLQQAVAVSVGERKMSVQIEGDVVSAMGAVAASATKRDSVLGDELLRKLLYVMPLGTTMGDRCMEGYTAELKTTSQRGA